MHAETLLGVLADGAWHGPEVPDSLNGSDDRNGTVGSRGTGYADRLMAATAQEFTNRFRDWGLRVDVDESGRCRLDQPLDLIDRQKLTQALHGTAPDQSGQPDLLGRLVVATELPSTNDELLRGSGERAPHSRAVTESCAYLNDERPSEEPYVHVGGGWLDVCIAEFQSAGRGRRGRRWQGPLASGLCLSVACRVTSDMDAISAMSVLPLVTGVTVRRVIRNLTGVNVSLKWPNDLVWQDRKLGGILVERAISGERDCQVVVGLGLNVALPAAVQASVSDWPDGATDLAGLVRSHASIGGEGRLPSRTELAAALVIGLGRMLSAVRAGRMPEWQDEWRVADALSGRPVRVVQPSDEYTGFGAGVDDLGALLVKGNDGVTRRVHSALVSVRGEQVVAGGSATALARVARAP